MGGYCFLFVNSMNIYREPTVVCKPNNRNVIVKMWEELAALCCESVESGRSINTSDNLYCNYLVTFCPFPL